MTNWKKRSLSLLMALVMIFCLLPVSAFAAEELPAGVGASWIDPAKTDETTESGYAEYEEPGAVDSKGVNDGVNVSKEVAKVSGENTFEVTLQVSTRENIKELNISPDAAVVLVVDNSGSMGWHANCKVNSQNGSHIGKCSGDWTTRLQSVQSIIASAEDSFLNTFAAATAEAQRKVAVVSFASGASAKRMDNGSYWAEATDGGQLANAKAKVTGLQAGGGTNIEAGLQLASNLLTDPTLSAPIKGITNRYVILLTDGVPTYHLDGTNSTSKTSFNGSEGGGNKAYWEDHKDVPGIAAAIKEEGGAKLLSVAYGSVSTEEVYEKEIETSTQCDKTDRHWHDGKWRNGPHTYTETTEKSVTVEDWMKDDMGVNQFYKPSDAAALKKNFTDIVESITILAQAWIVKDPMGEFVTFNKVTSSQGSAVASCVDNELTWNLFEDMPSSNQETPATYTYTLKYQVILNSEKLGFEDAKPYPTNGQTTLTYVVLKDGESAGDVTEEDLQKVDFRVPTVWGTVPSYDYKVEYYYQDTTTGEYPKSGEQLGGATKLHTEVQATGEQMTPVATRENYTYNTLMSTPKIKITADETTNVIKIYFGADEGMVTVNHYYRTNTYENGSLIEGTYTGANQKLSNTFVGNTYPWSEEKDHGGYHDWTVDKVTDKSGNNRTGSSLVVDKVADNNVVNLYYSRIGGDKDANVTVNRYYTASSWAEVGGKWQLVKGEPVLVSDTTKALPTGSTFTAGATPGDGYNTYTLTSKDGSGALTTEGENVRMVVNSGDNTINLYYDWTNTSTEPTKASIQVNHNYTLNKTTVDESGNLVNTITTDKVPGQNIADAHMGDKIANYGLQEVAREGYTSDTGNAGKLTSGTLTEGVNTIELNYTLVELPQAVEITVNHVYRDVTEVTTTIYEKQMQDVLDEDDNVIGQEEVEVAVGTKTETVYTEREELNESIPETDTYYVGQRYTAMTNGVEGYTLNTEKSDKLEVFPLAAENTVNLYYDSASTDVDKRDNAEINTQHHYSTTVTSVQGGEVTTSSVPIVVTKDGKTENSTTNPNVKAGESYTAEEALTYDEMTYPETAYTRDTADTDMTVTLQKGTNKTLLVKYSRAVTDLTEVDYTVNHTYLTHTMTVKDGVAGYYDAPAKDTAPADVGAGPFYVGLKVTLPDGTQTGFTPAIGNPAMDQFLDADASKNAFELVYEQKVPLTQYTMTVNHAYTTITDGGSDTQTVTTTDTKYAGEKVIANANALGFTLKHFTVDGGAQQTGTSYTVDSITGNVTVTFSYEKDTRTAATYSIGHIYITKDWDGKETTLPIEYEVENATGYMGLSVTATPDLAKDDEGKLLYTLTSATATNGFTSESEDAYVTTLADGHNEIVFTYVRNTDTRQAAQVTVNHHYTALDTYTNATTEEGEFTETFSSYVDNKLDFDGTGIYVGASYTAKLRTTNETHSDYQYKSSTPENYALTLVADEEGTVNVIDITYVRNFSTDPGPGPGPGPGPNPGPGGGGDGGDDGGPATPPATIPDENVPLGDLPTDDVMIPDEEVPLAEIPDEEIPLADAPKTGDKSALWLAMAACSAAGMAILGFGKKKEEETL